MANKKRSSFADLAEQFIKNTDPREARRAARTHLRQLRKEGLIAEQTACKECRRIKATCDNCL